MIALEPGDEPFPFAGERHERRSPVARVWLARHEVPRDERVHQPGHGPWRDTQRISEDPLGDRPAALELPEQMGARDGETTRPERLRHVLVQQDHELQDAIEDMLVKSLYSEE